MTLHRIVLVLALALAIVACSSDGADDPDEIVGFEEFEDLMTAAPGLKEASTNFDSAGVADFLPRVTLLVDSGFSTNEIEQVQELVETLEINHQESLEFPIVYMDDETVLHIAVFMDDIDAPDLAFFTVPGLAEEIGAEMEAFYVEREY